MRLRPSTGVALVVFDLTARGAEAFCRETARHVHDYMAIVVDDRVRGRPPIIQDWVCGGPVQIDLQCAPLDEVKDLAIVMGSGPLSVPLVLVDELVLEGSATDRSRAARLTALVFSGLTGLVLLFLFARRDRAVPGAA